jgi:hypothetical protein
MTKYYLIALMVTYVINIIGMSLIVYFNVFKIESFLMGALLMAQTIKVSEHIHEIGKKHVESEKQSKTN